MNRRNLLKSMAAAPLVALPVPAETPKAFEPPPLPPPQEDPPYMHTFRTVKFDESAYVPLTTKKAGVAMTVDLREVGIHHHADCEVVKPVGITTGGIFIECCVEDWIELKDKYYKVNGGVDL